MRRIIKNLVRVSEIETNLIKKSFKCKKCGKSIGWMNRFDDWFYGLFGIESITHDCKKS